MSQLQLVEYSIISHSMGGYVGLEILNQEDIPHELLLMHFIFWEDPAQKKSDRLRVSTIVYQKKEAFLCYDINWEDVFYMLKMKHKNIHYTIKIEHMDMDPLVQ